MDPDLLNNLYLIGGLLVAIVVIVWRFTSASQKAIQYSVDSIQLLSGSSRTASRRSRRVAWWWMTGCGTCRWIWP